MAYELEIKPSAEEELNKIKPFDRRRIAEAIENQLRHEPTVSTRNRRLLHGLIPGFDEGLPIWQLRVGDFRVFYHVEETESVKAVRILAVRFKPSHSQTEAIV